MKVRVKVYLMSVYLASRDNWLPAPNSSSESQLIKSTASVCGDSATRACQWLGLDPESVISELSQFEQERVVLAAGMLGPRLVNPYLHHAANKGNFHDMFGELLAVASVSASEGGCDA